eukprot:8199754-Alexandrium_andersonii.AAC.1
MDCGTKETRLRLAHPLFADRASRLRRSLVRSTVPWLACKVQRRNMQGTETKRGRVEATRK